MRPRPSIAAAIALALLTGCTGAPAPGAEPAPSSPALQLVAFDSCADALARLKAAARKSVGPWGLPGSGPEYAVPAGLDSVGRMPVAAAGEQSAVGGPAGAGYSGTNNHEAGVEEPDMVKTDGRRIVTVTGNVLRTVDPRTRRVTGELKLPTGDDERFGWGQNSLLLHGDRALVLVPWSERGARPAGTAARDSLGPIVSRLLMLLVDLTTTPRLLGEYEIDGTLVDARQVGATARVVMRSAPRLAFPQRQSGTNDQRVAANLKVIDAAPLEQWLPRYEVVSAGRTTRGQIGCDRLHHPATYSGASLVTVLSFDLARSALADGDPLTVVADGDTVYSTGTHLYVVNDQRWRTLPAASGGSAAEQSSEIHQFATGTTGHPRYVTSAKVPGWLVNQYAMSEWDGHLRVATTAGPRHDPAKQSSTVYVLRADGKTLRETGRLGGLGRGERIYAVRFMGDKGYVVTFRQTDPLYTVDLRNPAAPRRVGELKITGYSSYLHPVDNGRLVGVGQEATDRGRTTGTQISLFDVTDPARPDRLAQHHVRHATSEAEHDPHAFLYWPQQRLLVVPVDAGNGAGQGALALRVTENGLTEVGAVSHPSADPGGASVRRSLVVADALWTLSHAGLMATNLSTMEQLGWVALT